MVVVVSPVSPAPSQVAPTRVHASRMAAWARGAWAPALIVFVALGILLAAYFALGGDIRDFLHIGPKFLLKGGHASSIIRYDSTYQRYPSDGIGYDGQFYYFFAVDPQHAPAYMDEPAYRLSRPLYPMLARTLAIGSPALVPWTLLIINWLAIVGTVLAIGAILRRRGVSPWFALLYVAFPGVLLALRLDVTEPLAYALVALGLWLREAGVRRMWLWMGVAFALATLTRETAAAFPLALAIAATLSDGLAASASGTARIRALLLAARRPLLWLAGVMTPYVLWKLFVFSWVGSNGIPSELLPSLIPFQGLAQVWPWTPYIWWSALFVAIPGALCFGLAAWGLWKRPTAPELWALALHTFFFCLMLRLASWDLIASFRLSIGSALALLLSAPLLVSMARRSRLWMVASWGLWVSVAPFVVVEFFTALATVPVR